MWHVFRHLASPGAVPEQRQWRPKPCARLAALGNRLHVTLEKAGGKELVVVAHDTVPNEAKSAPVADGCLDSNIAVFGNRRREPTMRRLPLEQSINATG